MEPVLVVELQISPNLPIEPVLEPELPVQMVVTMPRKRNRNDRRREQSRRVQTSKDYVKIPFNFNSWTPEVKRNWFDSHAPETLWTKGQKKLKKEVVKDCILTVGSGSGINPVALARELVAPPPVDCILTISPDSGINSVALVERELVVPAPVAQPTIELVTHRVEPIFQLIEKRKRGSAAGTSKEVVHSVPIISSPSAPWDGSLPVCKIVYGKQYRHVVTKVVGSEGTEYRMDLPLGEPVDIPQVPVIRRRRVEGKTTALISVHDAVRILGLETSTCHSDPEPLIPVPIKTLFPPTRPFAPKPTTITADFPKTAVTGRKELPAEILEKKYHEIIKQKSVRYRVPQTSNLVPQTPVVKHQSNRIQKRTQDWVEGTLKSKQ